MKQQLENLIKQSVKDLYNTEKEIVLAQPPSKDLGDFATNIALILSKDVGKEPKSIANEISNSLQDNKLIQRLEIAGPGFLNIFIDHKYFFDNLLSINDDYGTFTQKSPKRIMMEYGHPNTHKLPHIGHLYSYIVGNSLSRILKATGNEVFEVNYQGDIGPHVAKCIYGWIQKGKPIPDSLIEKVRLLQECYQSGSELYEDEVHKEKIQEINKKIYDPNSDIQDDWKTTRQWSLDFYLQFEKFLGIDQKIHYLESEIWKDGMESVKTNIGRVFKESEGAIIFPGEEIGLHNRVFITQNNTPTYETKEVGLAMKKKNDWPFDLTITPTAREQDGYFDVVIKAIEKVFPDLEGKIKHIGFGMVSLSTGKMSSRKGNILSASDLVDIIIAQIKEIIVKRENLSQIEKDDITKSVALSAIKYAFLKSNILKDMKFDIEESISFEGNSGPYLQYVYARIQSVLRSENSKKEFSGEDLVNLLKTEEEKDLVVFLFQYPDTVKEAGDAYSPHLISTYLFELSQLFNKFYNAHSINSAESEDLKFARRILAEKTANVIKLGLNLLGIETVEKM